MVIVILISFYLYFPKFVESENTALQTNQPSGVLNITQLELLINESSYPSNENPLEKNGTISSNITNLSVLTIKALVLQNLQRY
jgi:hypothetical protein